jgi:hypothetical protein
MSKEKLRRQLENQQDLDRLQHSQKIKEILIEIYFESIELQRSLDRIRMNLSIVSYLQEVAGKEEAIKIQEVPGRDTKYSLP